MLYSHSYQLDTLDEYCVCLSIFLTIMSNLFTLLFICENIIVE